MAACFNCRGLVSVSAKRCPHCGVQFGRTWRIPFSLLSVNSSGWGISPTVYTSFTFRLLALLVPIWVPLMVALIEGGQVNPIAWMILLVFVIFIPGVHTIANYSGWSAFNRFWVSLVYVAASEVLSFLILAQFA